MFGIQMGIVIFFLIILVFVCHDEYRKLQQQKKKTSLTRFWPDVNERRRSVRVDAEIPVLYEIAPRKDKQKYNSITSNISVGGINLTLEEKLTQETILNLQLSIPEIAKPIFVRGVVVWTKEISKKFLNQADQRFFATGIKFVQLNKRDETILSKFIAQNAKTFKAETVLTAQDV